MLQLSTRPEAACTPFGATLRRLRERSGSTQEQLAERAGLSAKAISSLERGERQRPHPHTVRALASALELDHEEHAILEAAISRRRRRPVFVTESLRGIAMPVPPGAASLRVAFRTPEPDTIYAVVVVSSWLTQYAVTAKGTAHFSVQFSQPPAAPASIDWLLVR
jgi:transcriptional regulator with XRE-family HTH domain